MKNSALLYVFSINDDRPELNSQRERFENLTPIFPNKKIVLENKDEVITNRIIDIFSPIGLGQRGMIVAPP